MVSNEQLRDVLVIISQRGERILCLLDLSAKSAKFWEGLIFDFIDTEIFDEVLSASFDSKTSSSSSDIFKSKMDFSLWKRADISPKLAAMSESISWGQE